VGKAALDHTPELPLDDPRWLLFKVAHQRLAERTHDDELAAIQLAKALRQENGQRCMHLSATGERTLLPPGQWAARNDPEPHQRRDVPRLILCFGADGLRVMERRDEFPRNPMRLRGWFYVWQPDFDRIWPTASVDHAGSDAPLRVRPGPKPRGDWPTLLAQWLIAVAVENPKRLDNVDVLVIDAHQIKGTPRDPKVVRAKMVELLRGVRP
jgi:hypothetical protein